jgi:hypothetical protein
VKEIEVFEISDEIAPRNPSGRSMAVIAWKNSGMDRPDLICKQRLIYGSPQMAKKQGKDGAFRDSHRLAFTALRRSSDIAINQGNTVAHW